MGFRLFMRNLQLRLLISLEKRMHKLDEFSRNDGDWNELQNDITADKRRITKEISKLTGRDN